MYKQNIINERSVFFNQFLINVRFIVIDLREIISIDFLFVIQNIT